MYRSRLLATASLLSKPNSRVLYSNQFRRTLADAPKPDKSSSTTSSAAAGGAKVHASSPPPPPPGKPAGSANGMWVLLVAAAGAGVYYFKDDIFGKEEKKASSPAAAAVSSAVDAGIKNVAETKKVVEDLEQRVKKAAASAAAVVEEKKEVVAPVKPKEVAAPVEAGKSGEVNWKKVREEIVAMLDDEKYDDGSYGPVFVRLAWHHAGTYDKNTKKGGSEGAAMRFEPEAVWGANAGLDVARNKLEPIKKKFPGISYSDLWSFAGTVAIEEMGGPTFKWRPGRKDCLQGENVLPDGLLPDADGRSFKDEPAKHVREIFGRMGFNDQEMVALLGAHALGRCHEDRSGFWGPWTNAPTTFSNDFFRLLLEEKWTKKTTHKGKKWTGPEQFENSTGELMMLPTDLCLVSDPKFRKYVELYAKDEKKFFDDFSKAWIKMQENGVRKFHGWRRYILFGPRE